MLNQHQLINVSILKIFAHEISTKNTTRNKCDELERQTNDYD